MSRSGPIRAVGRTAEETVAFLGDPASYPHAPRTVETRETHMSWVFLAGELVFKMKKAVRYDFLDFSTLAARAHFVAEEIRLNRRLAAEVYRRAVALRVDRRGALGFDEPAEPVEWLVEMTRLPDDRLLDHLIGEGRANADTLQAVVRRLVPFYRSLPRERIAPQAVFARAAVEHGRTSTALREASFGLDPTAVGNALDRLRETFAAARPGLAERIAAGHLVEGHGDLRPEHICLLDPPVIIDCLEFDRELRRIDPFDEIVFLALECARFGADWALPVLLGALRESLGDDPPPEVLCYHWRYRALLRARFAILHLADPRPRQAQKWHDLAMRYLELADEAEPRLATR